MGIRTELLLGDLRPVYLGWLAGVQCCAIPDEATEPPVPDGLGNLAAPLGALADFLGLDPDLLAAAAERSRRCYLPDEPALDEVATWVRKLPGHEKDDVLVRLMTRKGANHIGHKLFLRFCRDHLDGHLPASNNKLSPRTAKQLLDQAERRAASREHRDAVSPARLQGGAAGLRRANEIPHGPFESRNRDMEAGRVADFWKDGERLRASDSAVARPA